jgi:hypothetical protein
LHPHLPLHQPQTPGWQLDWTYQPMKQNGPLMTNISNIKRLPTPLINLSMQPFRTWIHPITLSYHGGGSLLTATSTLLVATTQLGLCYITDQFTRRFRTQQAHLNLCQPNMAQQGIGST